MKFYQKSLDLLKDENGEGEEESARSKRNTLLTASYLNAAMCAIKLGDNVAARDHCDSVLAIDPNNEKALFRRGTVGTLLLHVSRHA